MIQLQPEFNRTDPLFPYTTLFRSPTGAPDYLFKTSQPDESVRQASETAMREIVGKKPMDFVLYSGRTEVATEVQGLAQSILDRYQTGIQISTVAIQNVQPPEQVQAAFDDAVKDRKSTRLNSSH